MKDTPPASPRDAYWDALPGYARNVWLRHGDDEATAKDAAWRAKQHGKGHQNDHGCYDCLRHARYGFNDGHYVR